MEKPTKLLIAGAICSALIAGTGAANSQRLQAKIKQLETACTEEGKREKLDGRFKLECDGKALVAIENKLEPSVGIQAEIVAAQYELSSFDRWPYAVALLVLTFSSVPWFWYFFLRRIRELRVAIIGK